MKIAFNPSNSSKNILDLIKNNKDIIFDLKGHSIYARGVEFKGTDTNTWRPVVDNLTSNSATSSLSANQGRVLAGLINGKSDSDHNHDGRYVKKSGDTMLGALNFANATWNKVGDDVYMGDHNIGGQLCIMGANSTTGLSFHKYGDASIRKSITFDGNTLYMNGNCNYATSSNQTNLLAINTVPNKTAATSIGSWSPISGRYVFHQKWTDTSTGGDTADFGIYLDGNLTANMVLDGYYNSLLGFRVIGATGGFLKANGTIDNSTYLTSHQSLSNYYTKGEIDNQLGKYKLKSSIWVPETKVIRSNFRDFLNKENLHKQALEELNLYRFFAQNDESNYSSKYNYPVVDSHAMVFSIDGNNGYIRSMNFDLRSNDVYVTSRVANGEWRSWVRLLNTSDVAGLKGNLTVHQYLSNTDTTWWPLIWGGSSHANTSDSTGAVYKSHDKLSWQTSSQTLYATHLRTTNLDTQTAIFHPDNDSTLKIYSGRTQDAVSDGHIGLQTSIDNTDGQTHVYPTQYGSRCVLALQPRGGSVYIGNMPNGGNGRKLNVNGDIGLFNTGSIRDLAIGGGIYWNPNVESATDGSDAASITLVKSGVAGGTTLVLSQMNDANDTIQFKTNTAARLYHNSYPILTTQNTYVNNHKGYINGTEITQVNNADTLDGEHLIRYGNGTGIKQVYYFHTQGNNTSYIKLGTLNTVAVTGAGSSKVMFTVKGGINFGGTNESVYEVAASTRGSIQVTSTLVRGNRELKFGYVSTSSNVEIWMAYDGTFRGVTEVEVSSSVSFTLAMTETTTKPSGFVEGSYRILASTADNVASATNAYHLRINSANTWSTWYWAGQSGQPSWLWGSNDGTNMYVWNPSNFRVAYAASAGNADTVDGEHASNFVRAGNFESSDLNKLDTYSFIKSVYSTNKDTSPKGNIGWYNVIQAVHRNGASDGPGYIGQIALGMTINTDDMFFRGKRTDPWKTVIHSGNIANQSVKYATNAGNSDKVDGYHATDGRTFTGNINWSSNWNDAWSDGTNKHPWYGFDHRYPNTGAYSTTITDYFGMTIKTANTLRLDCRDLLINGTNISNLNVASASKLRTARNIWGQSFDGTKDVNGTIYINNGDSENGAIILNNNVNTHARISAIGDQVVFNTGSALRFGGTEWEYSDWAGLKYDTVANTIYLGIADGTVFNYYSSKRSNGTLKLPGISNINLDGNARIGHSSGSLYIGNSGNDGWIYTQDIASQLGTSLWNIRQSGAARFGKIHIASKNDESANNNVIESDTGVSLHLNYFNNGNITLCNGGGNVGIGTMSPAYKLDVKGQVKASGFIHSDHSINDAVLLAGGGYKILNKLIFVDSYNYNATNKYNLTFHKLSGICNNLVWVDGHVYKSTSTSFAISRNVFPYRYDNNPDLKTICTMGADYISVDAVGVVRIVCNDSHRVGFFYTGIA